MANFSSEAHMQCEFFSQREKIFSKVESFRGYKIFGENYEGIEYNDWEKEDKNEKKEKKAIDFLLQHEKNKNKFKIVELKNGKKGCGVLGQILMYVHLLKDKFKGAEISVDIIANDIDGDLMEAVSAAGRKIIIRDEKKFPTLKGQIKEELGDDYGISDGIKYKLDEPMKIEHKNKLLVVLESKSGFKAFDKLLSYIWKEGTKEISGVLIISKEIKKESRDKILKKLPLTIRGNEIMNEKKIKVRFWKYNYDEKKIELEPIIHK